MGSNPGDYPPGCTQADHDRDAERLDDPADLVGWFCATGWHGKCRRFSCACDCHDEPEDDER